MYKLVLIATVDWINESTMKFRGVAPYSMHNNDDDNNSMYAESRIIIMLLIASSMYIN